MYSQAYSTSRSSHFYVACWSFLIGKKCAWSFPSEALDGLILKGQRSDCSCAVDSTVWRSPWSIDQPPQKSFAHLIQFWSWSQTLLPLLVHKPQIMLLWMACQMLQCWILHYNYHKLVSRQKYACRRTGTRKTLIGSCPSAPSSQVKQRGRDSSARIRYSVYVIIFSLTSAFQGPR